MTDNKKILKVLQGFIELTEYERSILVNELNDFINKDNQGKELIKGSVRIKLSASLGPTNDNSCPCCGKN